jgi:hypothetical protein
MTKILTEKIQTLSLDKQHQLLQYIDLLNTKKPTKQKTMDRRQQSLSTNMINAEEQKPSVNYIIW